MVDPLHTLVVVASENVATRKQFLTFLKAHCVTTPECTIKAEAKKTLEKVSERLDEHYQQPGRRAAVVVSDLLYLDYVDPPPSCGAKEMLDRFGDRPYTTMAIMNRSGPGADLMALPDIDRVVARDCSAEEFKRPLQLCLEKLLYLGRPPRRPLANKIDIQVIESQADLLSYFQLRHLVYTPMSYLPADVEQVQARLDIDWFDTRSIHIGAFEQGNGHKKLIGTARLITTEPLRPDHAKWTRELAESDPVLAYLVRQAVQALLPVFQSQDLEKHLFEASRQSFLVGELSRVIVHPAYRGAGLSTKLVEKVIALAKEFEVHELFLECLPMHERVYAPAGFCTLPLRGNVYMVKRTMMVMRLQLARPVGRMEIRK
jgi:predicted GNAT family N-acyltransferase